MLLKCLITLTEISNNRLRTKCRPLYFRIQNLFTFSFLFKVKIFNPFILYLSHRCLPSSMFRFSLFTEITTHVPHCLVSQYLPPRVRDPEYILFLFPPRPILKCRDLFQSWRIVPFNKDHIWTFSSAVTRLSWRDPVTILRSNCKIWWTKLNSTTTNQPTLLPTWLV